MTVKYVFHLDSKEADAEEMDVPGIPGGKVSVLAVSPNDGSVVVRLTGVSKDPAEEFHAATVESLSIDVTRKPLIALVWGGFYVMMAGGLLAFVKRTKEARKAVLEASEKRSSHDAAPVSAPGPALPAHTRSRLD